MKRKKNDDDLLRKHYRLAVPTLIQALEKRSFDAYFVETCEEANQLALSLIPETHVVGWDNCVSVQQSGIIDLIKEKYITVDISSKDPEAGQRILRQSIMADTYISTCGAVSLDGKIIQLDGFGGRVAATAFGPQNVILLVGMNKVRKNLESALNRAFSFGCVIAMQSFPESDAPCVKTGLCSDCTCADTMCASLLITRVSNPAHKIKVILINEDLGY